MTEDSRQPTPLWSDEERAAWRPPPDLKPSEWATAYRELSRKDSRIPGRWRHEEAPYLVGVMDLPVAPGVSHVEIEKASQGGVSDALRNLMGWMAHLHGDPVGIAFPNEKKGKEIVTNRILPMFRSTAPLAELTTSRAHDLARSQIRLRNGFLLFLMWSGSPASMASDPMRIGILDEYDKFVTRTGEHWNPSGQVEHRLTTYEDISCLIHVSTPTTRLSGIHSRIEDADGLKVDALLHYFVPCPKCGHYQKLVLANLHYHPKLREIEDTKKRAAAILRRKNVVWYECEKCHKKIRPRDKRKMLALGRWSTDEGFVLDADGKKHADACAVERWPRGTRLGMRIWAAYWTWRSWESVLAEYVRALDDFGALFTFITETLGEPWEQHVERMPASVYEDKVQRATVDEGFLPEWAVLPIISIDTQMDHFYAVVRGWGPGRKSARVWHNRVGSFEDLEEICFRRRWPYVGDVAPPAGARMVLIDTGGTRRDEDSLSRTMEVYAWAAKWRGLVRPIKGAAKPRPGQWFWPGHGYVDPLNPAVKKKVAAIRLWMVDVGHFADELAWLIQRGLGLGDEEEGTEELWFLNTRNDADYNQHLANVRKVPKRSGMKVVESWEPISSGARHDYWDCEVYQLAAAYMAAVHALPPMEEIRKMREASAGERKTEAAARKKRKKTSGWDLGGEDLEKFM